MSDKPLKCPRCGAEGNLAEVNTLRGEALVAEIATDGEVQYGGETEVDWDSQWTDDVPRFVCGECGADDITIPEILGRLPFGYLIAPPDGVNPDKAHLTAYSIMAELLAARKTGKQPRFVSPNMTVSKRAARDMLDLLDELDGYVDLAKARLKAELDRTAK